MMSVFPSTVDRVLPGVSDRVRAGFAGADADGFLDVEDEYLAVADAPGARGFLDGVDGCLQPVVGDDDLDLHFRQEVHDIFCATVEFGVPLLATKALCFGDRDPLDADGLKRLFNFVEFEWFDDRFDFFHMRSPPGGDVPGAIGSEFSRLHAKSGGRYSQ